MTTSTAREQEWKLVVTDTFLRATSDGDVNGIDLPPVHGWTVAASGEHVLRATYHDTPDHRLFASGHTLRHRTTDGTLPGTWTLKLAASAGAGAIVRDEVTVDGRERRLPSEIAALLTGVLRGAALGPVARLTTARRWTRLVSDHRRTCVEVDADSVTSRVGRSKGPSFEELEVELVTGELSDAERFVDALRDLGAEPAGRRSKLGTALEGRPGVPTPSGALQPGVTVAEALSSVFERALRGIAGNDPIIRLGSDPEGVHQARVTARRVRSHLRLLAPVIDADVADSLQQELRWLAGELGRVRDFDVLSERLGNQVRGLDLADAMAATALLDTVTAQRDTARATLLNVLDEPRTAELLDRLAACAAAPPLAPTALPDDPAAPVLLAAVERAWKRLVPAVVAAGEAAAAEPTVAATVHALHEVRKRAKAVRYALDLATPLLARRSAVRDWARRLADTQDLLGRINDSAFAQHTIEQLAAATADPHVAFVAGRLVQLEVDQQRRALRRWPSRWDALRKDRPRLRQR